jgi:hypothetical protein
MKATVKWKVINRWSDRHITEEDVRYWLESLLSGSSNLLSGDVVVEMVIVDELCEGVES